MFCNIGVIPEVLVDWNGDGWGAGGATQLAHKLVMDSWMACMCPGYDRSRLG